MANLDSRSWKLHETIKYLEKNDGLWLISLLSHSSINCILHHLSSSLISCQTATLATLNAKICLAWKNDNVMTWKLFLHYWFPVIHWSLIDSMASNIKKCSLCCVPEDAIEQIIELPAIGMLQSLCVVIVMNAVPRSNKPNKKLSTLHVFYDTKPSCCLMFLLQVT